MPKLSHFAFAPCAPTQASPAGALAAPPPDAGSNKTASAPDKVETLRRWAYLHPPQRLFDAALLWPVAKSTHRRRCQSLGQALPPRIDVAWRQQSLAGWRLEGHDGARVEVMALADRLTASLQAQGFHTVHITASGIAGLGATSLGADVIDCESAHLVVQALSTGLGANTLPQMTAFIKRSLRRELARQAPCGGFWVEAKPARYAAQVSVMVLGYGETHSGLSIYVALPHPDARPYTFLDQAAAIPLNAPQETWLWPCDAASDPFDDVRRGVYRLVKDAHWTDLAGAWRRRVQGSVPASPHTDAALWAPLLVHGYHAALLPLSMLVRDVMAEPVSHHAALILANACASADAAPDGLLPLDVQDMLSGALHICAKSLSTSAHHRLIDAFSCANARAAMALYAWAFALPTPLARQPGHPSVEYAHTDESAQKPVQLRVRLGPGAFWTPSFDPAGEVAPLPALVLLGCEVQGVRTPARELAWLVGAEPLGSVLFDTAPADGAPYSYRLDPNAPADVQHGLHRLAAERLWQHAARAACTSAADGIRVALAALLVDPTCNIRRMPKVCREPQAVLSPQLWLQLTSRLDAHWQNAVAAMHTMTPKSAAFVWARLETLSDARTWLHTTGAAWPKEGLREALAARARGPDGGIVPFADEMDRLVGYAIAPVHLTAEQTQMDELCDWVAIWLRLKRAQSPHTARITQLQQALRALGEDGLNSAIGALVRCKHAEGKLGDAWLILDLLTAPLASLSDEAVQALLACLPDRPSAADQVKITELQQEHAQRMWHLA